MSDQTKLQSAPVEKLLYRPKEAAVAIGTSPSWVYARIADGTLPCVRLAGRVVRIRRVDLMRFAGQP
jgi:excisionase family DNA binding protein